MSACTLRYHPVPDRDEALRESINHKRVERLYTARRSATGQTTPGSTSERKPLGRPCAAHQVWSMNFVFERT
mgnify:CR=1 FL=1